MKNLFPFLATLLIVIVSSLSFTSCDEDEPITDLGFTNESGENFYEGVYDMLEVRVFCTSPESVNLSADRQGYCVWDYCHTGSVLEIKQFNVPGTFDYSIEPAAPIASSGGVKFLEDYNEFFSEWGFSNGNLATYYPVSQAIGESCWLFIEWEKK